jgi:cobyrinic acid a,c-diamide synthase
MNGIVISGTGSGAGKTSITTGLLSVLSKSMTVQAYKIGPDFIDTMYHTVASGRQSRNLDTFLMDRDTVGNLVGFTGSDADLCVVEGVRGLYEGLSGTSDECSTSEIAKLLGFPVVIVVNARSLTRTAAAMVNGIRSFDPDINMAGVILNNVSGSQHEEKLRDAFSRYTDVEILGVVRRDTGNAIGQRHLGLDTINSSRREDILPLEGLIDGIDTDRLIEISGSANAADLPTSSPYVSADSGLKVAVPRDDAYCFYYEENFECMRASGMELEFFSPLAGDSLPDADIYYIGGGYPELHADRIAENGDFLEGLKSASEDGKAVFGECGGLMTMCRSITPSDGVPRKMAGIFDADSRMSGRHGPKYVKAEATPENPLFSGMKVRGHEFHYSEVSADSDAGYGFNMVRGSGIDGKRDGLHKGRSLGSYMHQHALSTYDWMSRIREVCGR